MAARSLRPIVLLFAAALAAVLSLVAGLAASSAARDLAAMSSDEVRVLQQRLTDAACYKGPIDGKTNTALATGRKFCPDQEPVLRIETGMHVAQIHRIGVDARCRLLATASDDKTVRLWAMPEGRLLRAQRFAIGEGDNGKLYAVAVSPDGKLVAAAGWDAHYAVNHQHSIYVFDAATGTSMRRIGALENVVNHLAFSPDGKKLAVSVGEGGIRVFDVENGREVMSDPDFADRSYGIVFGPDGALYATGYDGFLRRYGPDLERTAKVASRGGKQPHAIAVDPSGRKLAVGYNDATAVDILDAATLRVIAVADTRGIEEGDLASVAWSNDGTRLVAGGQAAMKVGTHWPSLLRSWFADGRRAAPDVPVSDDSIESLVACGDKIAFAAQDPRFGLWSSDGTAVTLQKGRTFNVIDKSGTAFTVSADATRLRFGLGEGEDTPIFFDVKAARLLDAPAAVAGLKEANITGLDVEDWRASYKPLYRGAPISLDQYEQSRSLAIRDDRAGFVLGTEWYIRAFAANGEEIWSKAVPGSADGVNFAKGGEVVVAAYYDGTIRWHRWSDGQELLALFIDRTTRRWVAWTPSGYYMASPGAEDLIGWHVNRGWNEPADFFPASRFRERFNRPDIVQLVLDTLDEGAAVRKANETSRRHEEERPIESVLPPVIKILSPDEGTDFATGTVEVSYSLRSPSGLPVEKIEVLLDGSPTGITAPGFDTKGATQEVRQKITVAVPPHDVDVGLIARSGALTGEVAHVKLAYRGAPPAPQEADASKPVLYALLVGVAHYKDPQLQLEYSAKDAQDLASTLQKQAGGLYREVKVRVLTDKDATVAGFKDGLTWLRKETTSRDLAVVFLAGHGVTDAATNQFWFLPYEADPSKLATTAVSRTDIMGVLRDLPGKKILFLDACHAGAVLEAAAHTRSAPVDVNAAINDFATAESGLVAYAASMGRELSVESDTWQHGAFTKALIEAIGEGKADTAHNGRITTALLNAYLAERVKELTDGEQHPVMGRPETVPDFPLALVK